jgi:hypothetical protein
MTTVSRIHWINLIVLASIWLIPSAVLAYFHLGPTLRRIQDRNEPSIVTSSAIDFICLNEAYCFAPALLILAACFGIYEVLLILAGKAKCWMPFPLFWLIGIDLIGLLQWPFFTRVMILPVSEWV